MNKEQEINKNTTLRELNKIALECKKANNNISKILNPIDKEKRKYIKIKEEVLKEVFKE